MYTKLSDKEKIALVGVLKWVVSVDPNDSLSGIEAFFNENEWGSFDEVWAEMECNFYELDELKDYLKTIKNKDAQDIILQVAKDVIISDVIVTKGEKEILEFLKGIWEIS